MEFTPVNPGPEKLHWRVTFTIIHHTVPSPYIERITEEVITGDALFVRHALLDLAEKRVVAVDEDGAPVSTNMIITVVEEN